MLHYSDTKRRNLSKDSLYLSKCLYFDSSAGLGINKAQGRSQTLWDVSYIFWIADLKNFFCVFKNLQLRFTASFLHTVFRRTAASWNL